MVCEFRFVFDGHGFGVNGLFAGDAFKSCEYPTVVADGGCISATPAVVPRWPYLGRTWIERILKKYGGRNV